jgi:hypothetical protein
MLSMLDRARVRDSAGALVKWRAAVLLHADPATEKPLDVKMIRDLAESLDITDADPLESFESDALAAERVARLEVGARVLRDQIDAAIKPFKSVEGLAAAFAKAEAEVERLRGIAADIAGYQATLGYELGDAARARREAPRLFPSES